MTNEEIIEIINDHDTNITKLTEQINTLVTQNEELKKSNRKLFDRLSQQKTEKNEDKQKEDEKIMTYNDIVNKIKGDKKK